MTIPTGSINFVAAVNKDIYVYGKDTMAFTITATDGNSDPIDLFGQSFVLEVKPRGISPEVLLSFSTADSSIQATGGSNNILQFFKNANVQGGSYQYDLKTVVNGVESTWMYGKFTVIQNISDISTDITS